MEKNTSSLVRLYLEEKSRIITSFPVEEASKAIDRVLQAYTEHGTVFACGNGGNAAFVANFICDLALHPYVSDDKSKPVPEEVYRMRCVSLADSPSVLTGILNDFGSEYIFSQQLIGRIGPHDVLFGFSGSGNSGNILKAFEVAKKVGATCIGITRGDGGKSKSAADICIIIPGTSKFPGQTGKNDNNFHFEDYLSSIPHMIAGILQSHVRSLYDIN